jgi:hypothetical protein
MNHPLVFVWLCIWALVAFRLSHTAEHLTQFERWLARAFNELGAVITSIVRNQSRR